MLLSKEVFSNDSLNSVFSVMWTYIFLLFCNYLHRGDWVILEYLYNYHYPITGVYPDLLILVPQDASVLLNCDVLILICIFDK